MFPLVTCVEEVRQAKALIEECKEELKSEGKEYRSVDVGIMVETPAAVFISDILAREVKFSLSAQTTLQATQWQWIEAMQRLKGFMMYFNRQFYVLLKQLLKMPRQQVFRLVCAVKRQRITKLILILLNGA